MSWRRARRVGLTGDCPLCLSPSLCPSLFITSSQTRQRFVIIGPNLQDEDWASIKELNLELPILVGGGLHTKEPYAATYTGRRPELAPKVAIDAGLRALLTGSDAFWTGLRAAASKMAETAPKPSGEEGGAVALKELRRGVTRASAYEGQLREYAGVDLSEL